MSSASFNGKRLSVAYGESMYTIAELAKMTELPAWTIYQRYRRGDRGAMLTRPCAGCCAADREGLYLRGNGADAAVTSRDNSSEHP